MFRHISTILLIIMLPSFVFATGQKIKRSEDEITYLEIDNASAGSSAAACVVLSNDQPGTARICLPSSNYPNYAGKLLLLIDDTALMVFDKSTMELLVGMSLANPLSHEDGGLEADVSSYNGLLKISGGTTSQITDNSSNWNTAYNWGDHPSTEGGLEAQLGDVTNVYTDNDGALNDDDVSLEDVQTALSNDFHNAGGDDDDVPDAGDFGAATDLDANGALNADSVSANELNAGGVEAELEAVLDHDDLQNITANEHLDWSQDIPNTIHADNYIDNDTNTNADSECSGDTTYYSGEGNCNDLDNQYVELTDSVDAVADVDTTTDPPVKNEVMKYNGTKWVPAAYDYSFVFDFDTLNDDATNTQLLGSGEWEAIGGITFTATYSNGPPTSCWITASGDFNDSGTGWTDDKLEMDDGDKTSEATDEANNYPDDSGDAVTFSALADGLTPDAGSYVVTFYNYFIYDNSTTGSGWDDGGLDAVAGDGTQVITSDHTRTITQALGDSDHLVFAHRKAGTTVTHVVCGTGSDTLTTAMDRTDSTAVTPLKETVSHSNAATNAKTEDFYVYTSAEQNIDAHSSSFTTLTSATVYNYLRIGLDDLATGWSNADFLALAYKYASTSDEHRTSASLEPGANDYLVYMYPDGWGDLTAGSDYETDGDTSFLFDGVTAAMTYEGANNCTNEVGFQDSYRVYVSDDKDYGNGAGTAIGLSSTQTYTHFYYGVTTDTDSFNEADCEGLAGSDIVSTLGTLFDDYTITPGAGEYILLCVPSRIGSENTDYEFLDGAFPFDFNEPEQIVDIENYNKWTENYEAYRSFAANLGEITVTVGAP